MQGAVDGREKFGKLSPDNDAYRYAMTRNILYRKGKSVETLACFEPDFTMMNEWYKQLFGESEGKDQKGLMPTSCIFSTDLHSMGQFLQDGARIMFETYVDVKHTRDDFYIEELEATLTAELPGQPEYERCQPQGDGGHDSRSHRRRRAAGSDRGRQPVRPRCR